MLYLKNSRIHQTEEQHVGSLFAICVYVSLGHCWRVHVFGVRIPPFLLCVAPFSCFFHIFMIRCPSGTDGTAEESLRPS